MSPTAYEKIMRKLIGMDAPSLFAHYLDIKDELDTLLTAPTDDVVSSLDIVQQPLHQRMQMISSVMAGKYGIGVYANQA